MSAVAGRAPARTGAAGIPSSSSGVRSGAAFAATLLFVTVEYIRPQDFIGPLAQIPISTLVAVPLALSVARHLEPRALRDRLVLVIAALAAFALVWTPFATNRFWAFQIFKFLTLELLAVVAIALFVDRASRLFALLALLGIGFGIQAVSAVVSGGRGLAVHFGDENDLALGMNVALPFAVLGAFAIRRLMVRVLLFALAGCFVAAVVASESRGGLVGLAAAGGALLCFARHRLLVIGAVAIGVAALALLAPAAYWEDMNTMFDPQDATRQERIRSWEQAQDAWRDNPLFGVGPGNIPWVLASYESFDTRLTNSLGGREVHSLYLTVLAELGLVGVALYGAALVLLVARCRAIVRGPELPGVEAHAWGRAILCSVAAWLVGGLFLSVLYYPHLYFLIALAIAVRSLQLRAGIGASPGAALRRHGWATPLQAATP